MCTEEVSREIINRTDRRTVPDVYTSDLCAQLIMWSWSRKAEHVVIGKETTDTILREAEILCEKYSSDVPITTITEQKVKIARLSVALAARLFHTDSTYQKIVVLPEHVRFITAFLDKIYSKPAFAYDIWSQNRKAATTLVDPGAVYDRLKGLGPSVVDIFMELTQIRITDIEEMLGIPRDDAKDLISFLVKQRGLIKEFTYYRKRPALIGTLRKLQIKFKNGSEVEETYDF
jgi:hypothetical protein